MGQPSTFEIMSELEKLYGWATGSIGDQDSTLCSSSTSVTCRIVQILWRLRTRVCCSGIPSCNSFKWRLLCVPPRFQNKDGSDEDRNHPETWIMCFSLLARWIVRVLKMFDGKLAIDGLYAWSESQVVLVWLMNSHVSFKVFISNRTSGASTYTRSPTFLRTPIETWSMLESSVPVEQLPEFNPVSLVAQISSNEEWFCRFSSSFNMIKVVAWMRKFICLCKKRSYSNNFLSREEMNQSLMVIVHSSQRRWFQSWY